MPIHEVRWTVQWDVGDVPVWISVAKFERAWRAADDDYIGPGARSGKPIGDRYARVAQWLRGGSALGMSVINLVDGVPSFTDGRHRFAWLRDHGARAVLAATDTDSLRGMRQLFGTRTRRTTYRTDAKPVLS